jgi:hypothetical protein
VAGREARRTHLAISFAGREFDHGGRCSIREVDGGIGVALAPAHATNRKGPLMGSRCLFAILLLSCAGMPAGAQEPPPGFLIERIVVEGLERDAARLIVLSESLLHEGRAYSEPELREAVYRVKRLPFVVDADMALRKGSERGAYELVVTVEAAKPIAYLVDMEARFNEPNVPIGADHWVIDAVGTLSARKFVGAHGLLFGSLQAHDDDLGGEVVQLGYTRYGLFGRRGHASVAVSSALGEERAQSVTDNLQTSLELGVPLTGNHALRFDYAWTHLVFSNIRAFPSDETASSRLDGYQGRLQWIYDSTDDPFVASEGLRVATEAAYTHQRHSVSAADPTFAASVEDGVLTLGSSGRKYWRLTPRQSMALDGSAAHSQGVFVSRLGVGTTSLSGRSSKVSLTAIHAVNLWGESRRRRLGDLRFESGIGVEHFGARNRTVRNANGTRLRAHTSLLFRHRWGLMKLSAIYQHGLGSFQ